MSTPRDKLKQIVLDALVVRGIFPDEAKLMIEKLAMSDEQFERMEQSRENSNMFPIPFGKHRGRLISEIPRDYLSWVCSQTWVEERYPRFFSAVVEFLNKKG